MSKRCEDCVYAENPRPVETRNRKYIEVYCSAPVPAILDADDEDRVTGHMAAKRCPMFKLREDLG